MNNRIILAILLPVFFIVSACYTAEFQPSADYYNRRKSSVNDVTIVHIKPDTRIHILGTLIVRDFSGAIEDENFRQFIKREAKKRGASGAWIRSIRITEETVLKASDGPSRPGHSGMNRGSPSQERNIQGSIATVRVILYNPEE